MRWLQSGTRPRPANMSIRVEACKHSGTAAAGPSFESRKCSVAFRAPASPQATPELLEHGLDPHGSSSACSNSFTAPDGPFSCSAACSPVEESQNEPQQQHQRQHLLLRKGTPQVSSTPSCSSHSKAAVPPALRASMVDFMSSTASALHLCSDALFTGVALLDRYLAAAVPTSQQLGCTACACLSVASKYEQAASPPLRSFLAFLSPQHTLCQLQEAEVEVLRALDYRISRISTTKQHLAALFQQLNAAGPLDATLYHLAGYLAELTLLEYNLCDTAPQRLAAACLAYALVLLGCGVSEAALLKATGMSLVQLQAPLTWLAAVHATVCAAAGNGCPYAATRKYTHGSCCCVATIPPLPL